MKTIAKGCTPVPKTAQPFAIVILGAPASGRDHCRSGIISTATGEPIAAQLTTGSPTTGGPDSKANTVYFNFTKLAQYHPELLTSQQLKDVEGNLLNLGSSENWNKCGAVMDQIGNQIFNTLLELRYNIGVSGQNMSSLVTQLRQNKYHITVALVHAPAAVVQERARRRALATGQFIAHNIRAQDEVILKYARSIPTDAAMLAQWAHVFVIADNSADNAPPACRTVFRRGAEWDRQLADMQAEIDKI
jgi:hypothetical protein